MPKKINRTWAQRLKCLAVIMDAIGADEDFRDVYASDFLVAWWDAGKAFPGDKLDLLINGLADQLEVELP